MTGSRLARWVLWGLAVVVVLLGLYLSVFFFPYPVFRHHIEHAGFSVYSDREIPASLEAQLEEARARVDAMELFRENASLRLFLCQSQRRFVTINRLAGKRYPGQALVISVAGNAFLSEQTIAAIGRRNHGRPRHSRLEGSLAAAIAHEMAHHLVRLELGFAAAKKLPVWRSEGYADYQANLAPAAADPDYDLRGRVELLLDDDAWPSQIDRRHFRWHVLVEYLCSVKGLDFAALLDEKLTEERARFELMAWFLNFDDDPVQ